MITVAQLRRKLLKLATSVPAAEPVAPNVTVNVVLPDMVGDLLKQIGDGRGGIRTSDRTTQVPG